MGDKQGREQSHEIKEDGWTELPLGVKLIRALDRGSPAHVRSVAFDPLGTTIAAASDDGTVTLWDLRDGGLPQTFGEGSPLRREWAVQFDPMGTKIASGGWPASVQLWDARSYTLLRTLEGHENAVVSVAFDPLSPILASGSLDNTVKLWDTDSGDCATPLNNTRVGSPA